MSREINSQEADGSFEPNRSRMTFHSGLSNKLSKNAGMDQRLHLTPVE